MYFIDISYKNETSFNRSDITESIDSSDSSKNKIEIQTIDAL